MPFPSSFASAVTSAVTSVSSFFRPADSQNSTPIGRALTRVRSGGLDWIRMPPAAGNGVLTGGVRRPNALTASNNIDPFHYLLPYDPVHDELPTLRIGSQEVKILGLANGATPHDRKRFDEHVHPFIRPDLTGADLRKLAQTHLCVGKYTEEDLELVTDPGRVHSEQYLVGQDKLVARNDIPKLICVGVLRGEIYDDALISISQKTLGNRIHYAIPAGIMAGGDGQFLLSDGILSRANANLEIERYTGRYIDDSRRYFVASRGHNLAARKFAVETDSLRYPMVVITALFTTRHIRAGAELRYPYDRSHQDVKWCLRGHPPGADLQRSPT